MDVTTHTVARARLVLTGLVAALLLVVLVQPASAAAPRLIVVEGGQLDEPVLLTDWDENLTLMTGWTGAFQQPDESRPHFDVLEYWLTSLPAHLSPSTKLGDPQARYPFHPATGDNPAVLGGYAAEQKALDVLEWHGVPAPSHLPRLEVREKNVGAGPRLTMEAFVCIEDSTRSKGV